MDNFPETIVPRILALAHTKKIVGHIQSVRVVLVIHTDDEAVYDRVKGAVEKAVSHLWPYRLCRKTTFKAELYLVDLPKQLPSKGKVLTADHINTGFSYPCKSMVVFRKQEWFKVLLHEMFHYMGLDQCVARRVDLSELFTVPVVVELREAYSEVWARLLQCKLLGEEAARLKLERAYSVRNMVRVLRHNGLVYSDLWGEKGKTYREQTNVFAYVVLAAILLHDFNAFIRACPDYTTTVEALLGLVRKHYRSAAFLKRVAAEESNVSDEGPFRMSTHEFNL